MIVLLDLEQNLEQNTIEFGDAQCLDALQKFY